MTQFMIVGRDIIIIMINGLQKSDNFHTNIKIG